MMIIKPYARPRLERRAYSLLEMATVVAILGMIAAMSVTKWGDGALRTASAQGFARSVAMSLSVARRQAVAEGTPAALVFTRTAGVVSSLQIVRAASGGDSPTDATLPVPTGVTVTTANDRWQFNYGGGLTTPLAGGTIAITDGEWDWTLTVNAVTGRIGFAKVH
jgi:prepilin-type N-terminal cleavage/methylation domain-containing protein